MKSPTITEMRKALADDIYDSLTNDRTYRSCVADRIVKDMDDTQVIQAYEDAELGSSVDDEV
jgi:hypothetical protein